MIREEIDILLADRGLTWQELKDKRHGIKIFPKPFLTYVGLPSMSVSRCVDSVYDEEIGEFLNKDGYKYEGTGLLAHANTLFDLCEILMNEGGKDGKAS